MWVHDNNYNQNHYQGLTEIGTVWKDLEAPETLNCPAAPDQDNGNGYNIALSGITPGDIKDPSRILLFADCESKDHLIHTVDDIDMTRHEGGFYAAFVDGHVELVKDVTKIRLK